MSALEKMPGHTRLYRRGATYYHRAAIPVDIADTYPKSEETFSLRTKDYDEALRLVRVKAVEVDERFDEHRRWLAVKSGPVTSELTPEQIQAAVDAYYAHILDEDEQERLEGFHEIAGDWAGETLPDTPRRTFEEHEDDWAGFEAVVKSDYARGRLDDFFRDEAEDVLTWNGMEIKLDPNSGSWRLLVRALQEAAIKASKAVSERDKGEVVPTPAMPAPNLSKVPNRSSLPLFSEATLEFLEEGNRGGWTQKTRNDYGAWLRDFAEAVGDRPIDQYGKSDGRKFKGILAKLPPNRKKRKEISRLSIADAAEKGAMLGLPPMSLENANKAMKRVDAFSKWAEKNYFDGPGPRPLEGMAFKIQESAQDKRYSFSTAQLTQIFHSPLYTGFHSPRLWKDKGPLRDAAWSRFWMPLLGLFTGARETELFSITVDDVLEEDGVHFLNVIVDEDQDRRVKTKAGRRRVPIHSQLIELGILDLVSDRKNEGEKHLFYDCSHKAPKIASDNFSKWFSRYLTECGAKTKKNAFHSFRHNSIGSLEANLVDERLLRVLHGHKAQGMGSIYAERQFPIKELKKAIESISYPGLDLTHIEGYRRS
ncbi:site-specific integrase [Aliiroseovarius crassostreae]|uniref:site-specific integrase n=1 Tax=Aliiroseovarius crassostreae TaxID=154981 RepID=UPI0021B01E9F|nr:site-specific integrase [Aliiroseovarius crassostreae]UWQ03975.1 tyrosine-type recombinase/integrase [Aliiroseovarius crassostreae]